MKKQTRNYTWPRLRKPVEEGGYYLRRDGIVVGPAKPLYNGLVFTLPVKDSPGEAGSKYRQWGCRMDDPENPELWLDKRVPGKKREPKAAPKPEKSRAERAEPEEAPEGDTDADNPGIWIPLIGVRLIQLGLRNISSPRIDLAGETRPVARWRNVAERSAQFARAIEGILEACEPEIRETVPE